ITQAGDAACRLFSYFQRINSGSAGSGQGVVHAARPRGDEGGRTGQAAEKPEAGAHMNEDGLNFKAHALLVLICGAGIGIAGWSATHIHAGIGGWITFAILGVAAAVAQLFPVHTPRNNAFSMSLVFTMPAVFLLPLP